MTTSNTTNFNLNLSQIVSLAYKRIGVLTDYRALTAQQFSDGVTLLNILVKSWIAKGNRLWKNAQGTLFVQPNQNSYILDGVTDNATELYVSTTTTASVNSGLNVIPVTSSTRMNIGDFFGVILNGGNIFWSIITNISSLNITIADSLTDLVNSGAYVYTYTTKINRPEDILNAQCQTSSTTVLPMVIISKDTYRAITIKTTIGIPNRLYYDKQLYSGIIYIWQSPSNANYLINFTFQKQLFDFTNPTDNPDFPVEWLSPIISNLALKLSGFNSISDPNFLSELKNEAAISLAEAEGFDRETTSIYFEPASEINTNTYR
jgi:hypothetical protein